MSIFTAILVYFTIDAVASLVVYFVFKYNPQLQDRLKYLGRAFFGVQDDYNLGFARKQELESRISKEIRNRKILKNRVAQSRTRSLATQQAVERLESRYE